MCKNIVPVPVPVVVASDVASGVTVAGLVGPAVDVSTLVVVVATIANSAIDLINW